MRGRDEIDVKLAKHFAWSFARPDVVAAIAGWPEMTGASDDAGSVPPAARAMPTPDVGPIERAASVDRARAACRQLASVVAEVWKLADEDAAARATKRLLARADHLGAELAGMSGRPLEAVRLVRLLVRHSPKMSRRHRERAAYVASMVPLEHQETAELLVEIARAGHREMVQALLSDEDWLPDVGDEEALVARLADVVDGGPTHVCRAVAIELLGRLERRGGAVPALRRALRLPSFAVRARALYALATAEPCAVLEADLVHVLRDLVAHAPPDALRSDDREEDEQMLADAVLVSLAHVQPEEAEEALLDLIDAEHETLWLDAGWATEALAVAFPETASAMVDHWLKCARSHERMRALAAIERLPVDMAEPRLRLAASDPAFAVRDGARRQWLDRFERPCPAGALDVPGAELLAEPPSDRFVSRLAVLHGRVREARQAMARALVAEAPSTEALVLLLQFIGDDAESAEPSFASRDAGWAATIVERFGARGVEGLCLLAARFPEPETFGWLRRLGDLVERGTIAREHSVPLRELAVRQVSSDDGGRVDDALRVLGLVGARPELLERILALALDDDVGAHEARSLAVAWPDRAIDPRLASEMAFALADRDWARLQYAASIALEREAAAAQVIAQRVLEVAEQDEGAVDPAVECARHLRDAGLLPDGWALGALGRPESPIFVVAARAWRGAAEVRMALEAALGSGARGGASAVEAAIALLYGEPGLSARDRRLVPVLQRAAPCERAELLHSMCVRGASLTMVGPYLEPLLVSSDSNVTGALIGISGWLRSPKAKALLRVALPRVVDVELRADILEALGASSEPFWVEG